MASRAQLSQDRSRERRAKLLAAAVELFAEGGTRAITHRAVAKQADLPSATTTYYFASIDDLIQEALSEHLTQWIETLRGLAGRPVDAGVNLDETAKVVGYVFDQRSPRVAGLELSIFLAAARDPKLRSLAGEALSSLETLAADTLRAIGIGGPERLAASIVALIAGTAVRRQSPLVDDAAEARMLATAIRDVVAASFMPDDQKAAALARLRGGTPQQ